jgi:hypothetical protein
MELPETIDRLDDYNVPYCFDASPATSAFTGGRDLASDLIGFRYLAFAA